MGPAADHGSTGISETKNQLAFYRKAGVDTVVATPHFYPNSVSIDSFLDTVNSAAAELTELLATEGDSPRVLLGAEVLYCENMHHMDGLEQLCIRGTDILLLELPLSDDWSPALFHTVRELNKRYRVVLAHIDRYIAPFRTFGIPERLERLPVLVQANGSFFLEKATASMALRLLPLER